VNKLDAITIDAFVKGTLDAFSMGRDIERERILLLIEPHLAVCNYKAVEEQDCDVCHWVETTVAAIKGSTLPKTESEPKQKHDMFEIQEQLDNLTIRPKGKK
jgi:hypothetical protein